MIGDDGVIDIERTSPLDNSVVGVKDDGVVGDLRCAGIQFYAIPASAKECVGHVCDTAVDLHSPITSTEIRCGYGRGPARNLKSDCVARARARNREVGKRASIF